MTFEIKEICKVDQSLSDSLLSLIDKEHWKIDTTRQKFKEHQFTEVIILRFVNNFNFNNLKFVNYETYDYYKSTLDQYLDIISNHFIIKDYTALIVNLKPNGIVLPHSDHGKCFELGHRLHIPIKTNKNVFFTVGETKKNMKVGEINEINNLKTHSVENNSTENRIHLIMDIFDTNIKEYSQYWMN